MKITSRRYHTCDFPVPESRISRDAIIPQCRPFADLAVAHVLLNCIGIPIFWVTITTTTGCFHDEPLTSMHCRQEFRVDDLFRAISADDSGKSSRAFIATERSAGRMLMTLTAMSQSYIVFQKLNLPDTTQATSKLTRPA